MKELKTILDESSVVEKLNNILSDGGVIAFVTDTVWGIGCLPSSEKGADKIYEIKGRARSKPLILMSNDKLNLLPYVKEVTPSAKKLMDMYFPGALTIVSDKSEKTPDFITSGKDTVGIRVPDNKFFQKLCSVINGHVLATTSANLSSHPSSKTYVEAVKSIGNMVDFVFEDYGCECAGMESTVVLTQSNTMRILRQGSIFLENQSAS